MSVGCIHILSILKFMWTQPDRYCWFGFRLLNSNERLFLLIHFFLCQERVVEVYIGRQVFFTNILSGGRLTT